MTEKGQKKPKTTSQFPNIYRIITDPFVVFLRLRSGRALFGTGLSFIRQKSKMEAFWVGMLTGIVIIAIAIVGLDLSKNILEKQKIDSKRNKIISEIQFWQEATYKYKGYRDAYFKLALLEYELGDIEKTNIYLKKTFELDPNFKPANDFKQKLELSGNR